MDANTLRNKFRTFFTKKDHAEIKSASLIPSSDDPTVLFTTAGMQPLVPNLIGAPHPKGKRIFDTQKCFRTPDIDEVGDDTHHTFFEMLGNWSLGDYFKEEAIELAYDFFVKELGLDPKKFAITIFKGDDDAPRDNEAEKIWLSKPGIEKKQIFEFDKEDNFWGPAGKTGPCGPCSEIHYDRGEQYGADVGPNSDENQRYVEIWNLVFMEYDKKEDGSYEKLSQKNVDTGVGFERLLAVLQGKESAFDTELFEKILKKISDISGKTYEKEKRSFRIIADHIRASTFAIGDGVTPGNEGRKYVLRRLIRRAIREGKKIGIHNNFLTSIAQVVINEYKEHYEELEENKNTIFSVLDIEESNFRETLERGEKILTELLEKNENKISGKDAFRLFDTYGFPLDLTKDFAAEHGISVDEESFEKEMHLQQERSRSGAASSFERSSVIQKFVDLPPTKFLGYTQEKSEAKVLGLSEDNDGGVFIVLDQSPFYAESGGQVGDTGVISYPSGEILVQDCQKTATGVFIHSGFLNKEKGHHLTIKPGDTVGAAIDTHRRGQIMRHHSLAHLFLGAAQKVLGNDVHQAGSHVNEWRTRFDFTFPRALKEKEIEEIEKIITQSVTASVDIIAQEKSLNEAKNEGVEAMFGEKYGDTVRTLRMGEYSYELCGGTHVKNTAQIGAVKIILESGVSAGVRRIELVCGEAAEKLLQEKCNATKEIATKLKVPEGEILNRLDSLFEERKQMQNNLESLHKKMAEDAAHEYAKKSEEIAGKKISLVVNYVGDGKTAGILARAIIGEKIDLAIISTTSGNIIVAGNGNIPAKQLLQTITKKYGGGGGGNKKFASGGGARGVTLDGLKAILLEK